MCLQERFRTYKPDLQIDVESLDSSEILNQYLFLESGQADDVDKKKGVKLGLPENLKKRREELFKIIQFSLLSRRTGSNVFVSE